MDTYTFTANELKRLLGEAIRLYEGRRDEQDAIPDTVRETLDLLDAERLRVTGTERLHSREQSEPPRVEELPVAQESGDSLPF